MSEAPIYFQFQEKKPAYLAFDMLMELGYNVHFMDHQHPEHKPTLQVFVDRSDLTSALEIAQAYGGTVLEEYDSPPEVALYSSAYNVEEGLSIPAHVVNEDLSEAYMEGNGNAAVQSGAAYANAGTDNDAFEPSGDGYDHFPAGIRL